MSKSLATILKEHGERFGGKSGLPYSHYLKLSNVAVYPRLIGAWDKSGDLALGECYRVADPTYGGRRVRAWAGCYYGR